MLRSRSRASSRAYGRPSRAQVLAIVGLAFCVGVAFIGTAKPAQADYQAATVTASDNAHPGVLVNCTLDSYFVAPQLDTSNAQYYSFQRVDANCFYNCSNFSSVRCDQPPYSLYTPCAGVAFNCYFYTATIALSGTVTRLSDGAQVVNDSASCNSCHSNNGWSDKFYQSILQTQTYRSDGYLDVVWPSGFSSYTSSHDGTATCSTISTSEMSCHATDFETINSITNGGPL